MNYFLGVDLGTTGTKTIIFDENGKDVARGYKGYPLKTPFLNAYEQDPEDYIRGVAESYKEAKKTCSEPITALSVSSQGGSFFLADIVDNKLVFLTDAITWLDTRAVEEFAEISKVISPEEYYSITGWKLNPASGICRLLWIKKHRKEIFDKTKIILSTSDYVYYKLTGKFVIDHTSAAMTGLYNVKDKTWDKKILSYLGLSESVLPSLVNTGEFLGEVSDDVKKELSLNGSVKVYIGAHDQYAANLGSNYFGGKDLLISSGTTWVVFAKSDKPVFTDSFLSSCSHPEGGYGVISSAVSSGSVLEWEKEVFNLSFKEMDEGAINAPIDENLLVYPFVAGAGTYRKSGLSFSIKNATVKTKTADIVRATMEGVCFEIKKIISLMRESGIKEDKIIISGGAIRSPIWTKILSDVLGKEVYVSSQADRCCFGAYSIARYGETGEFSKFPFDGKVISPDKENEKKYKIKFDLYEKNI